MEWTLRCSWDSREVTRPRHSEQESSHRGEVLQNRWAHQRRRRRRSRRSTCGRTQSRLMKLHSNVLFCSVQFCSVLFGSVLFGSAQFCSVLLTCWKHSVSIYQSFVRKWWNISVKHQQTVWSIFSLFWCETKKKIRWINTFICLSIIQHNSQSW